MNSLFVVKNKHMLLAVVYIRKGTFYFDAVNKYTLKLKFYAISSLEFLVRT